MAFRRDAAVEVQGGTSDDRWKDDKLSLQLKFKLAYGPPELEYDFFGGDAVQRFDTLILDSVLNYSWLHWQDGSQRDNAKYVQDQYVADLQLATGGVSPHGRYVHLYLNGLYWGIYESTSGRTKISPLHTSGATTKTTTSLSIQAALSLPVRTQTTCNC